MAMMITALCSAAFFPAGPVGNGRAVIAPRVACRMQEDELRAFLLKRADVSEKFVDKVIELCDEEMLDTIN